MSPIATGNDLIFDNSPFFDACIFQVNAGTNQYDSTLGITSTSPIVSLALNAPVTKQGDGTDITHGIFLQLGDVLAVPNSDGKFTFDYCNVLIIESQDSSHPFLGPGDSGSLVVSSGQPAGLLCAMTDDLDGLTVVPPLGLAIPFKTVLDKLSPLVSSGSSLVMAPLK
jgi:hypothetical protein